MTKFQSLLVHAKRNRKSVSQVYAELVNPTVVTEVPAEEPVSVEKPVDKAPVVAKAVKVAAEVKTTEAE